MDEHILQPLALHRSDIHSQNGEDGVLAELLRRLGMSDPKGRWCVEFGAWDGRHLSNTFALVEAGWNAIYIEGDSAKFKDLVETSRGYQAIVPVHASIDADPNSPGSIDQVLSKTSLPRQFDLISIDIDSFDLDVWESMEAFSPAIVIIEIDSGIPPGILWRHGLGRVGGNSFTSTIEVGRTKGYSLVCHTGNCIFVRNDLVDAAGIAERYRRYPELLFDYRFVQVRWTPLQPLPRQVLKKLVPSPVRQVLRRLV